MSPRLATPQILPGVTMPEIVLSKTEAEIQAEIMAALRQLGVFCWRNPAGQYGRGSLSAQAAGLPDIGGILPSGRALAIEVKRPGVKPRKDQPKQAAWLARARECNALVIVATSVDDVLGGLRP